MPKRKRDDDGPSFKLADSEQPGIGPLLVSFPSLKAPESTPFQCYVSKKSKQNPAEDMLIVGETSAVEFVSNEDETRRLADSGCRYLLALHDPRTSTVTVLQPETSPHVLLRTVKQLKSLEPTPAPSALEWKEARTALGDTFGTKKAKAALRAEERRHVDVNAMQGVMDFVMNTIDKGAEGLPTKEETKELQDSNRLIPPFNATTAEPAEVYALHDVIPEAEWKEISITAFDEASSERERIDILPYKRSKWILQHLRDAFKDDAAKTKKKKLKLIYYIAAMFAFQRFTETKFGKPIERDQVLSSMFGVPTLIVDGLLARFTEFARTSNAYHSTTTTQTKLFTHLFALCLRADNFVSDASLLATDLSLAKARVNQLFLSLGCKMKKITSERERAKLGLSDAQATALMAVLVAPVEFPTVRQRRVRK